MIEEKGVTVTDSPPRRVLIVSMSVSDSDDPSSELARRGHIGRICVEEFARAGDIVTVIDSDAEAIKALQAKLAAEDIAVNGILADLTDPSAMRTAAAEYASLHEGLDTLITTHSDLEVDSFEASSDESWKRVIEFNVLGAVWAVKAFLPLLKLGNDPAIVNCGSIDGILGNPQVPSFSVSKGSVITLTHVLAEELSRYGIRVNTVARAMIEAPGGEPHPMFQPMLGITPIGRPAYPAEVAAAIRFLTSPAASYITGVTLPVDGGRTAYTPGSCAGSAPALAGLSTKGLSDHV